MLICSALRESQAQLPPAPLPPSNTEDARTLPKGMLRFRALNVWTHFDNVFGGVDTTGGARPLGTLFGAPELGVRELPSLQAAESALRTLTGNATLRLDLGRLVTTADSRVVTTPLSLEYGLTNHLTIGVTVPVVQTHSTVLIELNPLRSPALRLPAGVNVGPNPAFLGLQSARDQNAALLAELRGAQADLAAFLAACSANPGSCSPESVDRATAARDRAAAYENAVSTLYGTTTDGSRFVPLGTSPVAAAVAASLASLRDEVNAVLGASRYTFSAPTPANGPAAFRQLQDFATDPAGIAFDSLGSPDRIGIGDVEVSMALQLFDGFRDTLRTGGMRARAAVRGVLRLGTGRPSDARVPFAIGTGTGQTSADVAGMLDLRLGRVVASLAGQYTAYLASAEVERVPGDEFSIFPLGAPVRGSWRSGNAMQLEATPRILLTDYFAIHGLYVFRRQEGSSFTSPDVAVAPRFDSSIEQRAGFGLGYSTLARYARGRTSVPIELFFSHMQTIAAHGGLTPQIRRAQIELRIYYRLRRGAR